jgi:hypothetical protein
MAATLAGSSIVSVWPSRDLTIRFWPLSLSTVPRMQVGVRAGLGKSGPNRQSDEGGNRNSLRSSLLLEETAKADSPLQEGGFEPSVPPGMSGEAMDD